MAQSRPRRAPGRSDTDTFRVICPPRRRGAEPQRSPGSKHPTQRKITKIRNRAHSMRSLVDSAGFLCAFAALRQGMSWDSLRYAGRPCYRSGKFPDFRVLEDIAMKKLALVICVVSSVALVAQQQRGGGGAARGAEPPHPSGLPSKAPEQGWVGEAWNPHEGGLLRVKVHLRFGVEAPV